MSEQILTDTALIELKERWLTAPERGLRLLDMPGVSRALSDLRSLLHTVEVMRPFVEALANDYAMESSIAGGVACRWCYEWCENGRATPGEDRHAPACPVPQAQALLARFTESVGAREPTL